MQLDKYISDIKEGIDKLGKWPTKMLTERSIEINYTASNIRLAGRVIIAFSVPNGHVNVRVSFYNYNCVRKESIVMRELSVDAVVRQVVSFVDEKETSLRAEGVNAESHRLAIDNLMSVNGYAVDCDSKYMAVFKGKGVKITFKYTDEPKFSVIITKVRKKCNEKDIMFETEFPEYDYAEWLKKISTGIENIRKKLVPEDSK
jgi:hypothetical protein